MIIGSIIRKNLLEQKRQIWLVLLTLLMAPFFVGVYYLMWETTRLHLVVSVVNEDVLPATVSHGLAFTNWAENHEPDSLPIRFIKASDRAEAMKKLQDQSAHAMLILPASFSERIDALKSGDQTTVPFELSGDLTDQNYMLAAVYAYAWVTEYIASTAEITPFYEFTERPAGLSGSMGEFDLYVPGLLILSTIMLMLTAAIAFVREAEQQTIIRLRLSRVRNKDLVIGISVVQTIIGLLAAGLTLLTALALGFSFSGSWGLLCLIIALVSLSIIAFSLILAALTRTVNQILVVGNFPFFLFMFFTGAMMPVEGPRLFSYLGYDLTLPGLMSPYHAVQAIRKISIYQAGIGDIVPEILALLVLTALYFIIGGWMFRRKHLNLN